MDFLSQNPFNHVAERFSARQFQRKYSVLASEHFKGRKADQVDTATWAFRHQGQQESGKSKKKADIKK